MPQGRVLDNRSKKPVANAYVIARYVGDGAYAWPDPGATARNRCYGSLVTLTNNQGEFSFNSQKDKEPQTTEYHRNQKIEATVYKSGYTMGRQLPKDSQQAGEVPLTFARYDLLKGRSDIITVEKTSAEEMAVRYYYFADILNNLCGDFTSEHWRMARDMLSEISSWAKTIRDWEQAIKICEVLNENNNKHGLNKEMLDCKGYDLEIEKIRDVEYKRIRSVVDDIDWGEGPSLELLDLIWFSDRKRAWVFNIVPPIKSLAAEEYVDLLSRLCRAEIDASENEIWFVNGGGKAAWTAKKWDACPVVYKMRMGGRAKLYFRSGKEQKILKEMNPSWCEALKRN